jgi:hypothetical protein
LSPVGNDVVDLAAPGNIGKSSDARFCGRVFTAEERDWIAGAACPDALLWAIWAAKEAAYKAVSRDDPAVCSIPCRYKINGDSSRFIFRGEVNCPADGVGHLKEREDADCSPLSPAPYSSPPTGRGILRENFINRAFSLLISTPRGELALRIDATKERVHAVAAGSEADIARLCRRVDRLDDAGEPSAFVRKNLLREIARRIGCPAGDLHFDKDPAGPGAPRVLLRDRLLTTEISLSHDGRFTAFTFDPVALIPAVKGRMEP